MADGGDGGVGGNGSVWWQMTHYRDGQRKALSVGSGTGNPKENQVKVTDQALGHDETPVSQVGARLGHAGSFLVTLRYRTKEEAAAAGQWVADNVRPGPGGWLLTILVPVIDRSVPEANPPFEVRVEW
jgi:hypothetical protein